MPIRHIEKVRTILKDAAGLEVSYAYDDLIFPQHSEFLLRFDDANPDNYFCHFHVDCDTEEKHRLFQSLSTACKMHSCTLTSKDSFTLKADGNEVQIHFLPQEESGKTMHV